MSDYKIPPVIPVTVTNIRKIMTSDKISESDKADFLRNNREEIRQNVEISITSSDFASMMQARPLIKFRPLKNSFTKRGDKIILAKSLNIPPDGVDAYIETAAAKLKSLKFDEELPKEEFSKVKTYVYRHGKKDNVIAFLNYELEHSKDIERTLSKTLEYGNGGIADYFLRPIHKLDEKTLIKIFNVTDKNLQSAFEKGSIQEEARHRISELVFAKLYLIRENQKII